MLIFEIEAKAFHLKSEPKVLHKMTGEQLIARFSYSLKKSDVVQMAHMLSEFGITPRHLINLSLNDKHPVAFHAAWVLENFFTLQFSALDYYLGSLIEKIPMVENSSVRRHFTKLIAIGLERAHCGKALRVNTKRLWRMNLEPLQELCLEWFLNPNEKPSVRAHCMEILYILSLRHQWLYDELPGLIETQMEVGGPAIAAKGREILKIHAQKGKVFR